MAVRPTKGEVKVITDILEDPGYDDAESMAKAILKATYQLLQERDWYVAGWQDTTPQPNGVRWNFLYGPYPYPNEAVKALESGIARGPGGAQCGIFKVHGIAPAEKRLALMDSDEATADPPCACGHRKSAHNVPGAGIGCYAPRHVCQCPKFTPKT